VNSAITSSSALRSRETVPLQLFWPPAPGLRLELEATGHSKKNDGSLRGWLIPRRPKKYQGWSDFFSRFFIVFLNSPHREKPKNVINKFEKKSVLGFLVDFFEKLFDTIFLQNVFCSVFELPSLRSTLKRDKTKKSRKN
jgi:hypothetical protein